MTVQELIAALQKCPPEARVFFDDTSGAPEDGLLIEFVESRTYAISESLEVALYKREPDWKNTEEAEIKVVRREGENFAETIYDDTDWDEH